MAEAAQIEWRDAEVCACARVYTCTGCTRYPSTEATEWHHGVTVWSWALTAGCVSCSSAGNSKKEVQVSRVHSHRWALTRPDSHGRKVSLPEVHPSLHSHFLPGPVYGTVLEIQRQQLVASHLLLHCGNLVSSNPGHPVN